MIWDTRINQDYTSCKTMRASHSSLPLCSTRLLIPMIIYNLAYVACRNVVENKEEVEGNIKNSV